MTVVPTRNDAHDDDFSAALRPLSLRATVGLVVYVLVGTGLLVVGMLVARFAFGASDSVTVNLIAAAIPIHGLMTLALICRHLKYHGGGLSSLSQKRLSKRMLHLLWQVPVMWAALLGSIALMLPVLESLGDPSAGGAESTMQGVGGLMAAAVFVGVGVSPRYGRSSSAGASCIEG